MDGEALYGRRQWLGNAPMSVAVDLLVDRVAESAVRPAERRSLVNYGREAMACLFEVTLPDSCGEGGGTAAVEALNLIDRLEDQMTVYRDTSEVSSINRGAASGPVDVEPGLFALLQLSKGLWVDTDGAFDISMGALSRLWGFYQRQGRWVDESEVRAVLRRVGMQHVRLDAGKITFDVDGVELNLGSIGKGYALDRAVDVLVGGGVDSALLSGGLSSMRAVGDFSPGGRGWKVGLRDPLNRPQPMATVRLVDRAMSTSGGGEQYFEHDGRRYGHIIDPRTGYPAQGRVLSATVVAPTAAEADALATAFFILGLDRSVEYCQHHPGIGAVLAVENEGCDGVEIVNVGVDRSDLEVLI